MIFMHTFGQALGIKYIKRNTAKLTFKVIFNKIGIFITSDLVTGLRDTFIGIMYFQALSPFPHQNWTFVYLKH